MYTCRELPCAFGESEYEILDGDDVPIAIVYNITDVAKILKLLNATNK